MKEVAIFAGGCFWCMVEPFDSIPGIVSIESGYTGGHTISPTYEEVCAGNTGHTEAVKIEFDPSIISYSTLLTIYWQQTDPTDAFGQFQDRGDSYRPVIFYQTLEQKNLAETSKIKLESSGRYSDSVVTQIEPAQPFYPAETYHQYFYKKDPTRYALSHKIRADYLDTIWGES